MSNSESNSDKSSASRSPESVLSKGLLRYLAEEPARRVIEGKQASFHEGVIASAEANLRAIESNCSYIALDDFESVMDDEIGSLDGLAHEDEEVQAFKIDSEALWMLFGAMKYAGESDEEAAKLAYIYYYHHCEEDEKDRKFSTTPERYRQDRLRDAIDEFEMGDWLRWIRRKNTDFDSDDWKNWTGAPSDICHDLALAIIDIGCGLWEPEYASQLYEVDIPESSKVISRLYNGDSTSQHKITPVSDAGSADESGGYRYIPREVVRDALLKIDSRSEETYKKTLKNLRDQGMVKVACLKEGVDYRIYPAALPDPPEAETVWFEGEEYEPAPEPTTEPTILADGGVRGDAPEAKQDLDRIRQLKEDQPESTDGPEVYRCPIDGCNRTVIDNPSGLRSHVRQSGDAAHEGKILTENLEVEIDEESYHANWGPGVRENSPPEQESIYAEYEGEWGPGALKSEVQS